jgi:hypothetical protein
LESAYPNWGLGKSRISLDFGFLITSFPNPSLGREVKVKIIIAQ